MSKIPVVLDTRVVSGSGGGPDKTILKSPPFLAAGGYRMICAYMHSPRDPGGNKPMELTSHQVDTFMRVLADYGAGDEDTEIGLDLRANSAATQAMLDIVDLARGLPDDRRAAVRGRLAQLLVAILTFAIGCGAAAGCFVVLGMWCFAVPPLLATAAFVVGLNARHSTP